MRLLLLVLVHARLLRYPGRAASPRLPLPGAHAHGRVLLEREEPAPAEAPAEAAAEAVEAPAEAEEVSAVDALPSPHPDAALSDEEFAAKYRADTIAAAHRAQARSDAAADPAAPVPVALPGQAPLNVTEMFMNRSNESNYTRPAYVNVTPPVYHDCFPNYAFAKAVVGEIEAELTVNLALEDGLKHHEAEVRECVTVNPKWNGDLFLACVDGELNVTNASCYPDVLPPLMTRLEVGTPWPVFGPNNSATEWVNMTLPQDDSSLVQTAPWDQFILLFNEAVQAGSGTITITEINPPEPRRDYRGPVVELPVEDYFKVFLGPGEGPWEGMGLAVLKAGQDLMTKNGGQRYELHVPPGAFLDRAGNPGLVAHDLPLTFGGPEVGGIAPDSYEGFAFGNTTYFYNVTNNATISTDLTLQFIVADRIAPHVNADWNIAFYPMHGDQGKYIINNITITFDEPVKFQGNSSATIRLEPRVSDDVLCYKEFKIHGCGPVYLDESHQVLSFDMLGPGVELDDDALVLSLYPNKIGHLLEHGTVYAVVIDEGDIADESGLNFTGLGSLEQGNYFFMTATVKQLELREQIEWMVEYNERRLGDTMRMFHLDPATQTAMDLPWKDSAAKLRVITLLWAVGEAKKILADPYGLPVEFDLQTMVNNLQVYVIEPRGSPFSDDWTCNDFASHMLSSVPFTCGPTAQRAGVGFDVISRSAVMYHRDGCVCQSKYANNCPFKTSSSSPYTRFGFVAMEEKVVGGGGDALCWYWGDVLFPEHGYLSNAENHYAATDPGDNAHDPNSDAVRRVKEWYSWHAAHRPTEGGDPNVAMVNDHYGIEAQSLAYAKRLEKRRKAYFRRPPKHVPKPSSLPGFRLRVPTAPKVHSPAPFQQVDRVMRARAAAAREFAVLATPPPEPVGWTNGTEIGSMPFPTKFPPLVTTPAPQVAQPLAALPTYAPRLRSGAEPAARPYLDAPSIASVRALSLARRGRPRLRRAKRS